MDAEAETARLKKELKEHIEEWVVLSKQMAEKKREYDEINTVVKDKNNIIKHYMMLLGSDNKFNCNLNEKGKWTLKLRTVEEYKPLSKRVLSKLCGEVESARLWSERERKEVRSNVVIKESHK